jgi:hypothetical protein
MTASAAVATQCGNRNDQNPRTLRYLGETPDSASIANGANTTAGDGRRQALRVPTRQLEFVRPREFLATEAALEQTSESQQMMTTPRVARVEDTLDFNGYSHLKAAEGDR